MRWRTGIPVIIICAVIIVLGSIPIFAGEFDFGILLRSSEIGGGGGKTASAGHSVTGTLAPSTPAGTMNSPGHLLHGGFSGAIVGGVSATGEPPLPRLTTRIRNNYPNPFNPTTTIAFDIAQPGVVRITVYDVRGRRVRRLLDQSMPAGQHKVVWDGSTDAGAQVASGVFFCRLESGHQTDVRKMLILE